MITAAFPCQRQQYTLLCGVGSSVGVEIAEKMSRRGELWPYFSMVEWKNSKSVFQENPKTKMGNISSALEEVFYYLPVYSSGQFRA